MCLSELYVCVCFTVTPHKKFTSQFSLLKTNTPIHRSHWGVLPTGFYNLTEHLLLVSLAICLTICAIPLVFCATLSGEFSLLFIYPGTYLFSLSTLLPQGDRGGHFTLQKRWTSFLKARLLCSLPEYDFHFNMLRSVFVMPGHAPQETVFYGIFGLEW